MVTYKSEILIGNESVWDTEESVDKQTVQIDVSRFTGRKELKFKLTKTSDDVPPPPPIDLEACWWTFDAIPANDYIEAQGDYGNDFDPAGSFTTMMLVEEINEATDQHHGLMGKLLVGLAQPGGWDVSYFGQDNIAWPGGIYFTVGKNGVSYRDLTLHTPGPMAIGRKVLIACMYTLVGDGNSIMRIVTHDAVNGKLSAQRADAFGPTANTALELRMGNTQRWVRPAGKVYWGAFYDGLAMTDQDVEDIWTKVKHPIDDFTPTVLNYFCQDVAATYNGDVCNGPNAPYVFDVFGTPVKGP